MCPKRDRKNVVQKEEGAIADIPDRGVVVLAAAREGTKEEAGKTQISAPPSFPPAAEPPQAEVLSPLCGGRK